MVDNERKVFAFWQQNKTRAELQMMSGQEERHC